MNIIKFLKMKNILFTLCLLLVASLSYSQLKVVAAGDVGIGTTSPQEKLQVNGNLALNNTDNSNQVNKRNHIVYGIGNAKRLQVSTASTTASSSSFFQMFGDETNSAGQAARAGEFLLSGKYIKMVVDKPVGAFGVQALEILPNKDLYVYTSNTFKQGSSGWTAISDKRLKNNIKPYQGGLKEIMKINPVHFTYNGQGGTTAGKEFIGLIAQEFQKISPNSINEYVYQDLEKTVKEEYLGVDDSVIKYMLVNAIKEQYAMIVEKEERIDKLESEISDIKDLLNSLTLEEGTRIINGTNVTLTSYDLAVLDQNIPNPFHGVTRINYVIPETAENSQIEIYSLSGKLMKTVKLDHIGEGFVQVNAMNIPSGTYTYNLIVDGKMISTKKMTLQ